MLVTAGLLLIAPPLWSVIINEILEKHTDYKIIGKNDVWFGFALILIGLAFYLICKWLNNKKSPENTIDNSTIEDSIVNQGSGNLTVNNINIYVQDEESLKRVLKTINYSNNNTDINFITNSNFKVQFINLIQSLPWGKNVTEIQFQNPERLLNNVIYKTSSKKDGHFYLRLHIVEDEKPELVLNSELTAFEGGIPILDSIYWSKYKLWTLNSVENFKPIESKIQIELEGALKNDLSVIIGDITFVINDFKLELIYDKSSQDNLLPHHNTYGKLIESNLIIDSERVELSSLEMAAIDSEINTKIIEEQNDRNLTTVVEVNVDTHIIKLSSLIIKLLAKFDRDTGDESTETIRRMIIELMKKMKAINSYQIPKDYTDSSNYLFEEAFGESSVIDDYNKYKSP
ncbi:hypothetical protein [Tenacibaculum maritimum]|uniref:hypothetical protein n=1 Tax=Tenacibaculum maritimum TaxID=107401 RepID=UPI000C1FC768|nr:hypothetical protein [Tenacibaculum maritimum]